MQRIAAAFAVITLALAIGACSAAEEPESATPPADASAPTAPAAPAAPTANKAAADCEIGTVGCAVPDTHNATVRNVTSVPIRYDWRPAGSTGEFQPVELHVKTINQFPRDTAIEIRFERAGSMVSYVLDPATPYSFRKVDYGLELYRGSHSRTDAVDLAPFKATPMSIVDTMLELGQVGPDDILFDLGCGDGRFIVAAAKRFGTRGVGIDIAPERILESNLAAREAKVEEFVDFRVEDAMKVDFSSATVLTLYLLPESLDLLRPKMETQLKPGARVVTHDYSVPGWEPQRTKVIAHDDGKDHVLYFYQR